MHDSSGPRDNDRPTQPSADDRSSLSSARISEPDDPRENPRPPMTRGEKLRMGCGITVLVLLAIIGITLGTGYLLWRGEPGYWKNNRDFLKGQTNADKIARAEQMERKLALGLSDPVDSDTQTIKFHFDEINSWFDSKFDAWSINQGFMVPGTIKRPFMVTNEGRDLVIAARVQSADVDQIMSAVINYEVLPDGRARLLLKSLRGGKLPLPAGTLIERFKPMIPPIPSPDGGEPQDPVNLTTTGIYYPPVIQLGGRDLRLLKFNVDNEGIEMTVKTERLNGK